MRNAFDEVYVVSDLHFGGDTRQIFAGQKEFPWLCRHLAQRASAELRLAFVINGDFIDFLADEKDPKYFDARGAVAKLVRVAEHATFADSFTALGELARNPHCELIINLGNHDLELAMTDVQAKFCELINSDAVRWVDDGSGVKLVVAGCQVLCLHGNEADITNVVDFPMLHKIKRARNSGKPSEALRDDWIPNAGTQLVIDAMNIIKRDYAFIDLLKPEDQAAVRVLLAIDFQRAKKLVQPAFEAMAFKRTKDVVRRWFGLLGDEENADSLVKTGHIPELHNGREWLENINQNFDPDDELHGEDGKLGIIDDVVLLWNSKFGKAKADDLREALEVLDADRSFEVHTADAMNEALMDHVHTDVQFLCSGHTHFARSLRSGINSHHFNSGTWAYLMRLDDIRHDAQRFDAMLARLRAKADVQELLKNKHVFANLHVIQIAKQSTHKAMGQLMKVQAANKGYQLAAEAGTDRVLKGN